MITGILTCPKCSGDYLSHQNVLVSNRTYEDQPGIRVMVCAASAHVEPNANDFLGRRNDIRISFACEECLRIYDLAIVQEKGKTVVYWL